MRIAIVFKGISYSPGYTHWTKNQIRIDFRDNIRNLKKQLIEPLRNSNHVDIYSLTYHHEFLHILAHTIEPTNTKIINYNNDPTYVLNTLVESLNMINKDEYDMVIITRFDINLKTKFTQVKYDLNKINFLCKANGSRKDIVYNDDTLFIIPTQYFYEFKTTIESLLAAKTNLGHHLIYNELYKKGIRDLSFIYNEVHEISVSRPLCLFNREINYFPSSFNLNEIKIIDNIRYKVSNSVLEYISKEEFEFLKPKGDDYSINYNISKADTAILDVFFVIRNLNPISKIKGCLKVNDELFDFEVELEAKIRHSFTVKRCYGVDIKWIFDKNDYVYFSIKNKQFLFLKSNPMINFVSFYTEGPPHDKCLDMTAVCEKYSAAIQPYVDNVLFYTPRMLRSNKDTAIYVKEHTSAPNPYNPGVHNIGFLKWKPYIILKELEKVKFGDIVYYRDGNIIKYPAIMEGIEDTRELVNLVLEKTDIFVPIENYPTLKMKKNVKREIFERLGEHTERYWESYGYNSSIVICRKSELSMQIIREWLDGCMQDELVIYEAGPNQHPAFGWNVQEQSILNVILQRHVFDGSLPIKYPGYGIDFRKFSLNTIVKIPKVAVLIAGEMRNFDNPNIIDHNNGHLLNLLNCDVFVSTWNKRGFSFNHGYYSTKDYSDLDINPEHIGRVYKNLKGINIENYDEWFNSLDEWSKNMCNKGFYNNGSTNLCPASVFPQIYKIWDANRMKVAYEHQNNFKYDIVIRMRGDMCMVEDVGYNYLEPVLDNTPKLFHLNPPNIYEPKRVYDIFFMGNSHVMNVLADSWKNLKNLIHHPYDNGLSDVNTCRILYIQAISNNVDVVDIPRALGDIYRDEEIGQFVDKVAVHFNRHHAGGGPMNNPMMAHKFLRRFKR